MSMDAETGLPRLLTTIGGDSLPDYWGEHEMALDAQDRLDEMSCPSPNPKEPKANDEQREQE
jgi:uncharacterized iron-regulated protein